jgi:hypothetical protein
LASAEPGKFASGFGGICVGIEIGGHVTTKKQKARAAAEGKPLPAKPKPKKKTSRGK